MIQGFFFPDDDEPEPCVRVAIEIPLLDRRPRDMDFLIDTGATKSSLLPHAALRNLRLSLEDLAVIAGAGESEERLGIGGGATFTIVPARYSFTHTDGRVESFDSDIRVAAPSAGNMYLPSLLGWDILRLFVIHLDWKQQLVTLS